MGREDDPAQRPEGAAGEVGAPKSKVAGKSGSVPTAIGFLHCHTCGGLMPVALPPLTGSGHIGKGQ